MCSYQQIGPNENLKVIHNPDNSLTVEIITDQGHGAMHNYFISPNFFIASVDFALPVCPLFPKSILKNWPSNNLHSSDWITINYCISGRCEVNLPSFRTIIVKSGDCCISIGQYKKMPKEYLYPLNHYTGLEIYLCPDFLQEDAFSLLKKSGFHMDDWLDKLVSFPVILTHDKVLNTLFPSFYSCLQPFDPFSCRLKLMDILNHIKKIGLHTNEKTVYYSRSQIQIAKEVYALLTAHPELSYDQKHLARKYNVSVNTLNNYFQAVYGQYIPAYMREFRMHRAAAALRFTDDPVYSIAASCGYSNASKFSAVFRKFYGQSPSEFRRKYRLQNSEPAHPC